MMGNVRRVKRSNTHKSTGKEALSKATDILDKKGIAVGSDSDASTVLDHAAEYFQKNKSNKINVFLTFFSVSGVVFIIMLAFSAATLCYTSDQDQIKYGIVGLCLSSIGIVWNCLTVYKEFQLRRKSKAIFTVARIKNLNNQPGLSLSELSRKLGQDSKKIEKNLQMMKETGMINYEKSELDDLVCLIPIDSNENTQTS